MKQSGAVGTALLCSIARVFLVVMLDNRGKALQESSQSVQNRRDYEEPSPGLTPEMGSEDDYEMLLYQVVRYENALMLFSISISGPEQLLLY
jgi:hypothetical protein